MLKVNNNARACPWSPQSPLGIYWSYLQPERDPQCSHHCWSEPPPEPLFSQSSWSQPDEEKSILNRTHISLSLIHVCLSLVHPTCLHYPREQKRPRTLYLARKGCLPPVISMSSSRSSMQRTGRPVLGQGETKKVRNLWASRSPWPWVSWMLNRKKEFIFICALSFAMKILC